MSTVSNTSPLLNLAIIGELPLIRMQFSTVLVPPAVVEEFRLDTERPGTLALSRALEDGWIDVNEPDDVPLVRTLRQDIDRGEAEAIALATEVDADHILIDERDGRNRARNPSYRTLFGGFRPASRKIPHSGHVILSLTQNLPEFGNAIPKKIPHLGIWDSLVRDDLPRDFSGRNSKLSGG